MDNEVDDKSIEEREQGQWDGLCRAVLHCAAGRPTGSLRHVSFVIQTQ